MDINKWKLTNRKRSTVEQPRKLMTRGTGETTKLFGYPLYLWIDFVSGMTGGKGLDGKRARAREWQANKTQLSKNGRTSMTQHRAIAHCLGSHVCAIVAPFSPAYWGVAPW